MRIKNLACMELLALATCAVAQVGVRPAESDVSAIPYSTIKLIAAGDSSAVVEEKAAKVLPRPNQTAWMRMERSFFLHFGPNTFRGVEWGDGHESPAIFNPTALDAEQWVRTVKEGGGRMIVLVCKHHDGFNLWPTRYSDHSVAASPWRGGKGNLVREVANAAHKYGIELGVYLSPADLYQLRTNPNNPAGFYGNESAKQRSVIPTDPASFQKNPANGRKPTPGFGSYTYDVDDYNRYFLNELYELLTEYGPIREVWFDGANPDPSVSETYDYNAWYDMIRQLQPQAIIFGKGPDGRWIGNEGGIGRTTEWSVIPLPTKPEDCRWPDLQDYNLGGRDRLKPGSYLWWYSAETNLPILYGWFWAPRKPSRNGSDLVDTYYTSVGRNGTWILNLSPDSRGLIPDDQVEHVRLMGRVVRETFAKNLAAGGVLTADSSAKGHAAALALDGSLDSWWEADSGKRAATLTLKLAKATTFDVVALQEAVDHRSQRIETFSVDIWDGSSWKQVDEQTTVGYKRLLRWNKPVTTAQVRIRITGSRMEPTLAEIGLYKQADFIPAPVIHDRDASGAATITATEGLRVVYTTDGTTPTFKSPQYKSPIVMPRGGVIQAICIGKDGKPGVLATKYLNSLTPMGWKVVSVDSEDAAHPAANVLDSNPETIWETWRDAQSTQNHQITIDMGHVEKLAGFSYVPRQDKTPDGAMNHDGVIDTYRFETSLDGEHWITAISSGRFWNIENNPVLQEATFTPVEARYFRLTALTTFGKNGTLSAAEISVQPAENGRK